ncbi:O-antigen ligase family protein [Reinekea marinisedimentorum]|uniref:O-antigen ligase-related domain-containing protein n=1 Tax=Reinekea marinisedimentorum TaxID=230495 RepID=A0A4R3I9X0_9GAMM|nr:O-antigen ligase family protein [Reinekea marinisedimentorum]TCS41924.1 hypothetical protein BCF53_10428 [Reinekea marinisedimentorum]
MRFSWLYAIGAVKSFSSLLTYTNGVLPIVGSFGLPTMVEKAKVNRYVLFALFLFVVQISYWFVQLDIVTTLRLMQLFLLFSLSFWVRKTLSFESLRHIILFLVLINVLSVLFELIYSAPLNLGDSVRRIFGLGFRRYVGIGGDANFSALLFASFSLIALFRKWYVLCLLCVLTQFLFVSRAVLLVLVVVVYVWYFVPKTLYRLLVSILITGCFLYPAVLIAFDYFFGSSYWEVINTLLSDRYVYHVAYSLMGADNWLLGVGYFNGTNVVRDYMTYTPMRPWITHQQHSIYLQILSEFGFVAFVYCYFAILKLIKCLSASGLILLLFLAVCFLTLNGLSEWCVWIGLSMFIRESDGRNTYNI